MADTGITGVCLLLGVCAVMLALLLMAGDVERNPGPTGKEGIYDPVLGQNVHDQETVKLVNDHLIIVSFQLLIDLFK